MSRDKSFRIAVRKFLPFESAIQKQWERFEAGVRTGLTLEAAAFDLHDLHQTLLGSNGLRHGAWDMAFVPTDWIAEAAAVNALADVAPRIASDPPEGYPAAWPDSLLRFQTWDTRVVALPYHDGPECLIYRKDLFRDPSERAAFERATGRSLHVPETWEDFQRVARHFQRPEQGRYGSVFAAFPDGHNTVYDFCLQLWTRGGELFDTRGRMQINTPVAREALAFYRNMVKDSSAVHPRSRELDSVKSGMAFASGEVAMMVNWFGFAALAETMAGSKLKGKVGIGLVPSGGGPHTSLNVYWTLGIGSGSPHADIAWRFLKHCSSPAMDKLLTLEGGIGCRRSTWQDPDVNAAVPFYRQMESLHEGARELPRLKNWADLAAVIDEMVVGALETDGSQQELVERAQERADRLQDGI